MAVLSEILAEVAVKNFLCYALKLKEAMKLKSNSFIRCNFFSTKLFLSVSAKFGKQSVLNLRILDQAENSVFR